MCPKKIEKRQRIDSDEIVETGKQKIKEAAETMLPFVGGLEIIDDDIAAAMDARKESDTVCGFDGISEKEIVEPSSVIDKPLLSAIDEAEDLQTSFRQTEEDLAQIDDSITELSIEELAKLFD